MSQDDPYDWLAGLFALLAFAFAVWWLTQGGDLTIAGGFAVLGILGVLKWWWGK